MQTQTKAAAPARQRATLSTRTSTSRKAAEAQEGESEQTIQQGVSPLAEQDNSRPSLANDQPADFSPEGVQAAPADAPAEHPTAVVREPESAALDAAQAHGSPTPALALAWTSEDESAFQAMLAQRKAAGYQRRGKDVGAQLLQVGDIAPNGTVVAVIVALVAEYGTIGRGKLLDAMAMATFPHPKAKPEDRGWCQGYVGGAIRDGFLAVADGAPAQEAGQ
jgi:hypothetical protein